MRGPDWNERYREGELPWDTGRPDEHLVKFIRANGVVSGKALEIGCGTGTNSLWLARHGFSVLGIDISQVAVDQASRKKGQKSLACDFVRMDFLRDKSLPRSFDFVFDRGCFHVFDKPRERSLFAKRVGRVLKTDGWWLSLIGSTEGGPRDTGPPRRSVRDVTTAIEPFLEIVELRSVVFRTNYPAAPKAWLCVARQRRERAQPSTRR